MRRSVGLILAVWVFSTCQSFTAHAQRPNGKQVDTFTFVVANDSHVSGNSGPQGLRALVDECLSMSAPPAFIVSTGNLTSSGVPQQYGAIRAILAPLAAAKVEFHAVPGIHEVLSSPDGKESFVRQFGAVYRSFDFGAAHFVLLDTTVTFTEYGHLDKSELDWLDKDLKRIRQETPIFVFLHHTVGSDSPFTRALDNENDLFARLRNHNVIALFTGMPGPQSGWKSNGILTLPSDVQDSPSSYRVVVSPLLVKIERAGLRTSKPIVVATLPLATSARPSILRVAWDDADNPYLERRRAAATLDPRALGDNPDRELAEYRLDDGPWAPMIKDRRDIWREQFPTQSIPTGMHSVVIRLTTSNAITYTGELLFERERAMQDARKWAVDLPSAIQSSPVLVDQSLIVSCSDGKLYAMNTQNGKRRWTFPSKGSFIASPVADSALTYCGSTDHNLYAVESATGHQRWKYDLGEPIFGASAVAQGIVCATGSGHIIGLAAQTGTLTWDKPISVVPGSNVITDGRTFYASCTDNTVVAIDAESGAQRRSQPLQSGSGSLSSPAISMSRLFVCSSDGWLHCLRSAGGEEYWKRRPVRGGVNRGFLSPSIVGDRVVVTATGPEGNLVALDSVTGEERWDTPLHQPIAQGAVARPAPDGRTIAVMTVRGHVVVLDAVNGSVRWGYELGPGNILSTPEYDGATVYTVTMANDVQALNAPVTISASSQGK